MQAKSKKRNDFNFNDDLTEFYTELRFSESTDAMSETIRPSDSNNDCDQMGKYYKLSNDNSKEYVLKNLSSYPSLTAAENVKLFQQLEKASDEQDKQNIRNKILLGNTGLIVKVAKEYNIDDAFGLEDRIQEGFLGLNKAIDLYDWKLGNAFSVYAIWWIKNAILKFNINKSPCIRIPHHIVARRLKIRKLTSEAARQGKNLSVDELSETLNLPEKDVVTAIASGDFITSLDAQIATLSKTDFSNGEVLIDFIEDESAISSDDVINKVTYEQVLELMEKILTPREIDVLLRRFGFYTGKVQSLQEIANQYHLTRETIRIIEKKAILKLQRKVKPEITE